jgi:hypothetical protein
VKKWIYILSAILIAFFIILFVQCYAVGKNYDLNPILDVAPNSQGVCVGNESGLCEFNPYIEGKDMVIPTPNQVDLSDPIYTQGKF